MDPSTIAWLIFGILALVSFLLFIGPDYSGQGFLNLTTGFANIFSGVGTGIAGLLTNIGQLFSEIGIGVGNGINTALSNITSGEAVKSIICAFTNTESCLCGCD